MLSKQESTDKYGATVINYQITQGDTFPLTISVKDEQGVVISSTLIASVKFKLGDEERKQVFEKDFIPTEDGKWKMVASHEETAEWVADTKYYYEIEVRFTDDFNSTPLSYTSRLLVLPQIK